MLEENLDYQRKIKNYFEYVLTEGINISNNDYIEIVTTSHIDNYLKILIECLNKYNANIFITFTDGKILEQAINEDVNKYIRNKIDLYNDLIKHNFKRLTVISPFVPPISRTDNVDTYIKESNKFMFIREYFFNNPHTIFAIPNDYWAKILRIEEKELWDKIFEMSYSTSQLEYFKEELSNLKLKALHFKTSLGTDLYVGLTKDFEFLGNTWKSLDNISYKPNIPCLEIFTSPNKYLVDGKLVSSKPLYYKNRMGYYYEIEFKDGKIISERGLEEILSLDENLYYTGEIALVLDYDNFLYLATLLDENTGCHLALGNSYKDGIKEQYLINNSKYHIDLVFGTDDLICEGITYDGRIIKIIENNKLVFGGNNEGNIRS